MFKIKQNDLRRNYVATLLDSDGNAVNLSTASSVRFIMTAVGSSTPKVDAAATLSDAANGEITYEWQAGDTDTAGSYRVEIEVTWADGDPQTWPADGYASLLITAELA